MLRLPTYSVFNGLRGTRRSKWEILVKVVLRACNPESTLGSNGSESSLESLVDRDDVGAGTQLRADKAIALAVILDVRWPDRENHLDWHTL